MGNAAGVWLFLSLKGHWPNDQKVTAHYLIPGRDEIESLPEPGE